MQAGSNYRMPAHVNSSSFVVEEHDNEDEMMDDEDELARDPRDTT